MSARRKTASRQRSAAEREFETLLRRAAADQQARKQRRGSKASRKRRVT